MWIQIQYNTTFRYMNINPSTNTSSPIHNTTTCNSFAAYRSLNLMQYNTISPSWQFSPHQVVDKSSICSQVWAMKKTHTHSHTYTKAHMHTYFFRNAHKTDIYSRVQTYYNNCIQTHTNSWTHTHPSKHTTYTNSSE